MNKIKPEFGNLKHIALLEKEQRRADAFAEALEHGEVGYREIRVCGECDNDLENNCRTHEHGGKKYRMCNSCDSIIERIS